MLYQSRWAEVEGAEWEVDAAAAPVRHNPWAQWNPAPTDRCAVVIGEMIVARVRPETIVAIRRSQP